MLMLISKHPELGSSWGGVPNPETSARLAEAMTPEYTCLYGSKQTEFVGGDKANVSIKDLIIMIIL